MLSSAKIGVAAHRYYTQAVACRRTDYYLGIGEAAGRWWGPGLAELGLEPRAVVSEAELEALFARALHPVTGQRLGRAWRIDGVSGFDLTFSAPKSVSSLWALGNPQLAGELRAAHTAAVQAALTYLDTHASWSRRGMDGVEQTPTAGLSAATFEHRTSRCADPQLHTHALVINKVFCDDGKWRTVDATELFHHKKSAGMIYQAALRSEIHSRTGLVFDIPDSNGQAEILGVPHGLLKLWSKRTAQIEPEAAAKIAEYENSLGRTLTSAERAAVTKTAVLKTRPGKTHPDAGTLRESWADEAIRAGHDPEQILTAVQVAARERGPALPVDPQALGAAAVSAAASVRSTFSRADVAGQVAARLPIDARGAAAVVEAVEDLTAHALGLDAAVSVGRHPHGVTARASDARWAGAEVLAAEARVLSLAERGRGGGYGRAPASILNLALEGAGLDPTQQAAVEAITGGGDFLAVLTAPAGAGKTRTLGSAAAAWQRAGYRVIGLAPSARAAAELAAATGGSAETLAKWRVEHDRRGLLLPQQRARTILDGATVVIVDEASMANTHDLDVLITAAARKGAKVVLVGDPAQIGVVNGPGGMLAALVDAGHGIELGSVHRFTQDWEREASLALRKGDPTVLAAYQHQDRIHPCPDPDQAIAAVHAHWASERAAGREVLMMARTRADVDALNTRARASAQDSGEVQGPAVQIGEREWQAGDLLRTRRNNRALIVGEEAAVDRAVGDEHVRNGDRWRVLDVHENWLHVEHLDRGQQTFLPAEYVAAHAEYGWAATIDAAQGATVDIGIVLVRPGIDREHLYVALTRGREANHAYVIPDPARDPEIHHGLPPVGSCRAATPAERARDVLATALASSGAQDAAHTVREAARARAIEAHRLAAEPATKRDVPAPVPGPAMPAEHAETAALLERRRAELREVMREQDRHRRELHQAETELGRTSRWSRSRRHELHAEIEEHRGALQATISAQLPLGLQVEDLSRQVEQQTREWRVEEATRPRGAHRNDPQTPDPGQAVLAPARPVNPAARGRSVDGVGVGRDAGVAAQRTRREAERRRRDAQPRRSRPGPTRRDDGPSISR